MLPYVIYYMFGYNKTLRHLRQHLLVSLCHIGVTGEEYANGRF